MLGEPGINRRARARVGVFVCASSFICVALSSALGCYFFNVIVFCSLLLFRRDYIRLTVILVFVLVIVVFAFLTVDRSVPSCDSAHFIFESCFILPFFCCNCFVCCWRVGFEGGEGVLSRHRDKFCFCPNVLY